MNLLGNYDTSSPYVILAVVMVLLGVLLVVVAMVLAVRWDALGMWSEISGRKKQKAIETYRNEHSFSLRGGQAISAIEPNESVNAQNLKEFTVQPYQETPGSSKVVDFGQQVRSEEEILTGILEDVETLEGTTILNPEKDLNINSEQLNNQESDLQTGLLMEWGSANVEEAIPTGLLQQTDEREKVYLEEGIVTNILGSVKEENIPTGYLDSEQQVELVTNETSSFVEVGIETNLLGEENLVSENEIGTGLLQEWGSGKEEEDISTGVLTPEERNRRIMEALTSTENLMD